MYSIGELIDKLVIENIKIFNLRGRLHNEELSDDEYLVINEKMNIINSNRVVLIEFLNDKIDKVLSGKEPNQVFRQVKTYVS